MSPTSVPISVFSPRGLLIAVGVCLGIGLLLTMIRGNDAGGNLVYSLCIGLSSWALIESAHRLAARLQRGADSAVDPELGKRWPGGLATSGAVLAGSLLGYTIGATLGNALVGRDMPMPWELRSLSPSGSLAISLVAGATGTYLLWLRGRLAGERARAEQAQRLAAETRLKLLESQLEPHMLFNTLANLRALIALDPPRAQDMLDRLIDFLRATLAASRAQRHPLAAEFARIADYLALMQVRLGARLRTELALPPELAAVPVPPLLLQPLVENAIQHGIEPHRAGGRITLRARRVGALLELTVHDDGAGLGPAAAHAGRGFGTQQVRERLATLYGDGAVLRLEPAAGGGTLATLTLPWSAA
jgi:two-component sensor histidine kinase